MSNFNHRFNWKEYFELSLELAGLSNIEEISNITTDIEYRSEAKLRASISRAYYSAHCIARNYLRDELNDVELNKKRKEDQNIPNEHDYVRKRLSECRDSDLSRISQQLNQFRRLRNKADYRDRIENIGKDTEMSITYANSIITTILNKLS